MNPLLALKEYGQSYWMDDLRREMFQDGSLAHRVREEGLGGITSNPSTFSLAIGESNAYDDELRAAARAGKSVNEIYEQLVTSDVRTACDLLRPVYDQTQGLDGYVSLEVSPHLAHDSVGSIEEARRLAAAVGRPNLMIKIPGTIAGLPAIEELLWEGINVNITLLFSVERYKAVAHTWQRALERRLAAGRSVRDVASVASFFLSRIDTLVDELLAHRMRPDGSSSYTPHPQTLLGTVAVANAKLAYANFSALLKESRWQALEGAGARPQRLLWASTSTKNPAYPDLMYVEPLIGPHTVNTMPLKTIAAFADHGKAALTVNKGVKAAARTLRELRAVGIDLKQITAQLENEGIQKFIEPYDGLLATIGRKRVRFAAGADRSRLAGAARQLRRDVIRMTTAAGSGHPTSCMSCADIVATLFFETMRWDPGDPRARDVDTFLLSKGHAAPILWAALVRSGASDEDLLTLRDIGSTLEGHPTPNNPWVKVATGSLGQGLSAANGMALANRLDGIEARIYCLLGDGECSEGSVWEAAQFAAMHDLCNVVAIVDQN
ncbi:MAG: transaldolase, partial [Proteobacteria bacterium]